MNAGWSIFARTKSLRNGAYAIPLIFQINSLIVKGHVRSIGERPQAVRTLQVQLLPGVENYANNALGWEKEGSRWIGVYVSTQYQNPLFIPGIDYTVEWMTTTLIKKDQSWIMVEYCENVSEMVEPDRFIEETPGRTLVPTFLTHGIVSRMLKIYVCS